ncbi:MAG: R3H domain-containing nucleic acid-binding protein [bacterium]
MGKLNLEKAKKIVEEFFKKMTFGGTEVDFISQKESALSISLKSDDPQVLIGQEGETLLELQRILGIILKKNTAENFFIDLDINNYKKRKIEYLKELARSSADEVALIKKEKILDCMPAYERRIVHMELAGRSDVISESQGEGRERRIIIRPRP